MDAFNTNDFTPPEVRLKKRRKISKEEEEEGALSLWCTVIGCIAF